jgi:hypothetical protein
MAWRANTRAATPTVSIHTIMLICLSSLILPSGPNKAAKVSQIIDDSLTILVAKLFLNSILSLVILLPLSSFLGLL